MKVLNMSFIIFAVSISFVANAGMIHKLDLAKEESKVEFTAIGKPSLLKISGIGGKAKGLMELDGSNVKGDISVEMSDMTTGISLRDTHMKEKYLEVNKFPNAVLKISDLKFEKDPYSEVFSQKNVPFKGKMNIHGIEHDVEGTADIDSSKSEISVSAKTKTTITAHQIAIPTYMGIKIADEVQVSAELKIKK